MTAREEALQFLVPKITRSHKLGATTCQPGRTARRAALTGSPYLYPCQHASGGDTEVKVSKRFRVRRFVDLCRPLLWQIVWWRQRQKTCVCH